MANSVATHKTLITCALPDNPEATLYFYLDTAIAPTSADEVVPKRNEYKLALDENGDGSIYLPTPDNTGVAQWNWKIRLPHSNEHTCAIAYSASAQTLADILGQAALSEAAAAALLAAKADKVTGATAGNLAQLDASGNLSDSGIEAADVVAVNDPTADQVGYSPLWTGAAWSIGKTTVQDYAIGTQTDTGLVLAPNYEHEIPFALERQYGEVNDLHGGGVGSTITSRQDGLYTIAATVYQTGEAISGVVIDGRLRKNRTLSDAGTLIGRSLLVGTAETTHFMNVTRLYAYLVAGDTVHLTIQHDHSGPLTFYVLYFVIRRAGQIA